uniref:Agglutinin C-terminal domain-containing protein n=1 Tax=viral metagenome TaxID=1070528 RepID=A0A6M3JSA2_9ZZZZ
MSTLTDLQSIRRIALYYKEQVVPPFKVGVVGVYHYADLAEIVHDLPGSQTLEIWDSWWAIPSLEDSIKIIEWDLVDQLAWKSEVRDCDKFAFWFRGMTAMKFKVNHVAVVRDDVSHHAYCLIWLPDHDVPLLFEPQTDKYWLATDPDPSPGMHDFTTAKILT